MRSRSLASRLDSGSSSSRIAGSTTSERASATRCCWPPRELAVDGVRSRPSRPTAASTRATRSPISAAAGLGDAQAERDVLEYRHVRPHGVVLEHHAHARAARAAARPAARTCRRPSTGSCRCRARGSPRACAASWSCRSPKGPSRVTNSRSSIARIDADQRLERAEALVDAGDVDERHRASLAPAALARRPARARQPVDERGQRQDDGNREDGERRHDLELAQIVEPIDGDGDGLGAAGVEQDGGAELAEGRNEDQQERDQQPGARQREQDAADRVPPGRAGDAAGLLQRRIDLAEGGIGAARGERDEAGDVGREQDPDRAVDRHRQADEGQQDADRHHRSRQPQRQDRQVVEQAAPAHRGAQIEIGDRPRRSARRVRPRRLRA